MPGISILCRKGPLDKADSSVDYLLYEPDYTHKILFQSNHLLCVYSGYEDYPVNYIVEEDILICIEGLIYNKTDKELIGKLKDIATAWKTGHPYKEYIQQFIDVSDGDFIIYFIHKKKDQCLVFTDTWGRLKSFHYSDGNTIILTRDHPFMLNTIPQIDFDRFAMAEFLIMEYTLEDKTLITGVHKTTPGFLLEITWDENEIISEFDKLFIPNFDTDPHPSSRNKTIQTCVTRYLDSLKSISTKMDEKHYRITADLSGGYDSRAIFFGLCSLGVDADYFTDYLISGDESPTARQVAQLCNKDVMTVHANYSLDTSKLAWISYITGCNVNAITSLSTYYDSLERKKHTQKHAVRFGGFGGEYIRHPYREVKGYKTISAMLKDNIFVRGIGTKDSSEVLKLSEKEFLDHLDDYFSCYEEKRSSDKVKHFYFDYYNNLVNLGEDRARLHFWTVQPLSSRNLMATYSHQIPRKQINTSYFIEFIRKIDPNSCKTPIYGSKIKLDSKLSIFFHELVHHLDDIIRYHKFLRDLFKRLNRLLKRGSKTKYTHDSIMQSCMDIFNQSKVLSIYLDKDLCFNIIQHKRNKHNIKALLTLILYIDEVEKKHSNKIVSFDPN